MVGQGRGELYRKLCYAHAFASLRCGYLAANAVVFFLVEFVVLFVQEVAEQHQYAGDNDHAKQQSQRLSRLNAGNDVVDRHDLILLGYEIACALVFKIGYPVCVFSNAEDDVAEICYENDKRRDILVKNGRREVMIASSREPVRYSLYSTVFMMEIIMMR